MQFLSAPDGTPLWVFDVEPGSTPDITAARNHVLPALYKAAAGGLPVLADKGYIGAGIGIRVPHRRPKGQSEGALHADNHVQRAGAARPSPGRARRRRTQATVAQPAARHPQPEPHRRT
ncbi:transposase family protein [Streptomyces sp. P5_D11]